MAVSDKGCFNCLHLHPREVAALRAEIEDLRGTLRAALPSLAVNKRSYAQRALEDACRLLEEDAEEWKGVGEAIRKGRRR